MKKRILFTAVAISAAIVAGCVVVPAPGNRQYYRSEPVVVVPPPRVDYLGPPPVAGYLWTPPRRERERDYWRQPGGRWEQERDWRHEHRDRDGWR